MTQTRSQSDGDYRRNVAIVLYRHDGSVLVARRIHHDGWQFPQGGIALDESAHEAAYRELNEELGLERSHVNLIAQTESWFKYDVPSKFLSSRNKRNFRGQIQKWFLFEFLGTDRDFQLDLYEQPEFDRWKWVDYWFPADSVIHFKRSVYRQALAELERFVDAAKPREGAVSKSNAVV